MWRCRTRGWCSHQYRVFVTIAMRFLCFPIQLIDVDTDRLKGIRLGLADAILGRFFCIKILVLPYIWCFIENWLQIMSSLALNCVVFWIQRGFESYRWLCILQTKGIAVSLYRYSVELLTTSVTNIWNVTPIAESVYWKVRRDSIYCVCLCIFLTTGIHNLFDYSIYKSTWHLGSLPR